MRHFDFHTSFDNIDLPQDVTAILRATAHNKRLFNADQIDDEDRYTTGSLRYERDNRPRAQFRELCSFPERLQTEAIEEIFEFFDYGQEASRFQLESWDVIHNQLQHVKRTRSTEDRASVVSAPTGFGKTAAFLGPAFHNSVFDDGERTIIVYPSRALLKDQLGRILETVHKVNNAPEFSDTSNLSVGAWMGKQPYKKDRLMSNGRSYVNTRTSPKKLEIASHWKDELSSFYIERRKFPRGDKGYRVFDETYRNDATDDGVAFDESELVLHRDAIKASDSQNDKPDILLTTLESLEILAGKPHYDIVLNADYFIFDEIHQYQGLRGSHAAQIIRNIRQIREKNAVFVGASATVDDPGSFATKLFGFSNLATEKYDSFDAGPATVETLDPYDEDIDDNNTDALHYYFMLTDRDQQPEVASQYLQHAMMVGRSLLEPQPQSDQPKVVKNGDTTLLPLEQNERRKLLAFIQSKSQINRLKQQFNNADKVDKLWKYHVLGDEGDWDDLASATGHRFLDQPWELDDPLAVYSGSKADVAEIDEADIIHGTSFLEVGIDIENLHFVSQYRPPENLTTFKQRAGRAAREEGSSGHVFVHLSAFAGDTNFHYRADRFVDSEVTTPIWAENRIISWMHDRFREFYSVLEEFQESSYYHGSWSSHSNAEHLIRDYFGKELQWDAFRNLLLAPNKTFSNIFGFKTSGKVLLQGDNGDVENLDNIKEMIEDEIDEMRDELSDIRQVVSEDTGDILLDQNAVGRFIVEISQSALDLIEEVPAVPSRTETEQAVETLGTVFDTEDPTDEVDAVLTAVNHIVVDIQSKKLDMSTAAYPSDQVEHLNDVMSTLQHAIEDGSLERLARKRQAFYYLRQTIEEIEEYRENYYFANHGQLGAIKSLFRAAYYYNRSLKRTRDVDSFQLNTAYANDQNTDIPEEYTTIWFIPPNYFNDAGKYYTLETPRFKQGRDFNRDEQAVPSILSQYIPYKPEHKPSVGDCQVFQPRVVRDDSGPPKFDFAGITGEEPTEWLRVPERIRLSGVHDQSGKNAQGVYRFDTSSLKIIEPDEEPDDGESEVIDAKLFSEAHIETQVTPKSQTEFESGNLSLQSTNAKAWLDSVSLEITPQLEIEPSEYIHHPDKEGYTQIIESSTPKLGYNLNTRAVTWNLEAFFDQYREGGALDTDAMLRGLRVPAGSGTVSADDYKEFAQLDPTESACVTAAHLLTLLVADVTGVDPNLLLYGYDTENKEVHVFEQTEGGQGIVDLFCEHQETRPDLVLSSLYRLLHNPQILNERLWADPETVSKLYGQVRLTELVGSDGERKKAVADIEEILEETLSLSYPDSISRLSDEVAATIERFYSVNSDDISIKDCFKLKQWLAEDYVYPDEGDSDIPDSGLPEPVPDVCESIISELGETTVRSLFIPPDVDGCKMNLQLNRTISDVPQEAALSYCLLEQLESYIVDAVPQSRDHEEIVKRQNYWAWLDASSEEVLFISW